MLPKATILARGYFKNKHGKTAHGVIRYGTRYEITSVIDETCAGEDAGAHLGLPFKKIPIVAEVPAGADVLIIGVAPSGGRLPQDWRTDIETAIENGMDIVSGLHQFLGDDPELASLASGRGVSIWDVRRPPEELVIASGYRAAVPVVLTHGTDACVGKRTAALELVSAAKKAGYNPGFVATGQTGIMIGCDSGVVVDSLPADFISGMVEKCIKDAETKGRDIIFIEGQGSLGHFAYGTSTHGILYGSRPHGLVVVHAPGRTHRSSFPGTTMPGIEDELKLIAAHMEVPLLGIALNFFEYENFSDKSEIMDDYKTRFGVPVEDVLSSGADAIFEVVQKTLL